MEDVSEKSPRFKHFLGKEMKIRKELRNMGERRKMYNIHLIGVVQRDNLKNELRKNSYKFPSTDRNGNTNEKFMICILRRTNEK